MKSFEQYLEDQCFELHPEILDDDMQDFFEGWLEKQDVESLLVYSEGWGRHIRNTILQEVTNLTK